MLIKQEGEDLTEEKTPYFIDPEDAPRLTQMPGLETTILTGLHGERMMMVLNATSPGHTVPMHSHPHEQTGVVYAGRAILRIGDEERIVGKGGLLLYSGQCSSQRYLHWRRTLCDAGYLQPCTRGFHREVQASVGDGERDRRVERTLRSTIG